MADITPLRGEGRTVGRITGLWGELLSEFFGTFVLLAFGDGVAPVFGVTVAFDAFTSVFTLSTPVTASRFFSTFLAHSGQSSSSMVMTVAFGASPAPLWPSSNSAATTIPAVTRWNDKTARF